MHTSLFRKVQVSYHITVALITLKSRLISEITCKSTENCCLTENRDSRHSNSTSSCSQGKGHTQRTTNVLQNRKPISQYSQLAMLRADMATCWRVCLSLHTTWIISNQKLQTEHVKDVTWRTKYENILQPTCTLYAFPFIELRHSKQQSVPSLQVYIHLWIQMTRNIIRIVCDLVQSKIRLFSIPPLIASQEGNTASYIYLRLSFVIQEVKPRTFLYESIILYNLNNYSDTFFVTGFRDIRTFFCSR
jgi:hypothetical protein